MIGVEKRHIVAQGVKKERGIPHLRDYGANPVAPACGKTDEIT